MLDINLRIEFDGLLQKFGHYIIYRRASKYVQCTCYSTLHNTGDSECPICQGSGRMLAFEKLKVIDEPYEEGSSYNSLRTTNAGRTYQPTRVVFMRYDTNPRIGDTIYLVGWNKQYPVTLHSVLEVKYAEPVRGDNGRIELHHVFGRTRPDLIEGAKKTLSKIAGKEVEVRTSC